MGQMAAQLFNEQVSVHPSSVPYAFEKRSIWVPKSDETHQSEETYNKPTRRKPARAQTVTKEFLPGSSTKPAMLMSFSVFSEAKNGAFKISLKTVKIKKKLEWKWQNGEKKRRKKKLLLVVSMCHALWNPKALCRCSQDAQYQIYLIGNQSPIYNQFTMQVGTFNIL